MTVRKYFSIVMGLALAACSGQGGVDGISGETFVSEGEVVATTSQALFKDSARVLNIVAHQDDDFGVMSPDLANSIAGGRVVRSIVLTAGDADVREFEGSPDVCQSYVEDRGRGQKAAWEKMANVSYGGAWTVTEPFVLGHKVRLEKMPMPGRDLSIAYLGFSNADIRDLERLWDNRQAPILTVAMRDERLAGVTYTRSELVSVLRQMILDFAPTHINLLDAGKTYPLTNYPDEHTDHVHSALFAIAALQMITPQPTSVRMYRTYNMINDVENVAPVDAQFKHDTIQAYAPYDGFLCEGLVWEVCGQIRECQNPGNLIYGDFETRQYPVWTVNGVTGAIRAPGSNQCLRSNGTLAGSTLAIGTCSSSLQAWSLPSDGTLRVGALCVSSNTGSDPTPAATRNATLRLETCNAALNRQRFLLTGKGQLRGPDATCVDTTTPGTLKLQECADSSAQLGFTVNFTPPAVAPTNGTDFANVTNTEQFYRALSYGDLDGDGDSDVCIRRTDGVWCSKNTAGVFSGYALKTTEFRDGNGYNTPSTGSTLQLVDVDGDNKADLCARKAGWFDSGIYCAKNTSNGDTFAVASKRTSGNDFGDLAGYDLDEVYYRNIRIVNVGGTSAPDVCARNAAGIECATNNGNGFFSTVSQRENIEFTDDQGWWISAAGTTVQFADIDGDLKTDVCGRGMNGIICMLGTGSTTLNQGFDRPHIWSDTGDFSDDEGWSSNVSYYGTIRLGDINGDGRADVCGRNASGVWCGLSTGQAFGPAKLMVPADPFTDTSYGAAANATSLSLLRLNADTHADLCLRGTLSPAAGTGLRCYLAP